jgi:hypothetical protein
MNIAGIKSRRHGPAIVMAGLMLLHLWYFLLPGIIRMLGSLRGGLRFRSFSGDSAILLPLLEILLALTDVVVWFLSVFITWAAFRKSRKIAYVFILAYFLLPLAIQPSTLFIQHITKAQRAPEIESRQHAPDLYVAELQPVTAPPLIDNRELHIPIGELLLLAGVWCLYKKEAALDPVA